MTPVCKVCGQRKIEAGNAHDQNPPEGVDGPAICKKVLPSGQLCGSRIYRWCPCNDGKLCFQGHQT
jgi:hypothetical protein